MAIRRVAILGAGGLGAAYGSRFLRTPRFETTFIARGERFRRLQEDGLWANGIHFDVPLAHPERAAGAPADLILVALKQHHLQEALPDLAPFVGAETILLSVMNGLDSEALLGERYGMEKLLYAIALGIDAVREQNRIVYANAGKIIFGEAHNERVSARVRRVQEALSRAGIPWETPPDMVHTLWRKFMINVGINQASAVLRAPYAVFQNDGAAQAIMISLMREAMAVAAAEGVTLSEGDLQGWIDLLATLSPDGRTSMLQDIDAGRKTEVEIFGDKVVALGRQHQIATPVNHTIAAAIKVLEKQH